MHHSRVSSNANHSSSLAHRILGHSLKRFAEVLLSAVGWHGNCRICILFRIAETREVNVGASVQSGNHRFVYYYRLVMRIRTYVLLNIGEAAEADRKSISSRPLLLTQLATIINGGVAECTRTKTKKREKKENTHEKHLIFYGTFSAQVKVFGWLTVRPSGCGILQTTGETKKEKHIQCTHTPTPQTKSNTINIWWKRVRILLFICWFPVLFHSATIPAVVHLNMDSCGRLFSSIRFYSRLCGSTDSLPHFVNGIFLRNMNEESIHNNWHYWMV